MECEKMQEQLITGYLDKELGVDERARVDKHLENCAQCREFFGAVRKVAILPFKNAPEMKPDDIVWERIQARLEAEKASASGGFWNLVDRLISRIPLPVPLMRVTFATALILVVVVLVQWPSSYADPVYTYMSEQMIFMGDLKAGNTDLLNGDLKDYEVTLNILGG